MKIEEHEIRIAEYYKILELVPGATDDDIKKAYRVKARLYHPDINPSPQAKDKFILATEAYEFLMAYNDKVIADEEAFIKAMNDWRKYRQDISRRRANVYSRSSYVKFKNSKLYKTTRIFDATGIIFSLIVSVMVIVYTIIGYTYRLHHPLPGFEEPSVFVLIMLLTMGMLFFVFSIIYLKAYMETSKKNKKK